MKFECNVYFDLKFGSTDMPNSVYQEIAKMSLNGCSKKVFCETTTTLFKIIEVESETKEEAMIICGMEFSKFYTERKLKPLNVKYEVKESTIMNTYNAHEPKLVDYINYIWCRKSESFKPILKALYERDCIEANDKGIYFNMFKENFESFAYEFMMHVCDDADLETIINFVRYREKTENGRRTLYAEGWVN